MMLYYVHLKQFSHVFLLLNVVQYFITALLFDFFLFLLSSLSVHERVQWLSTLDESLPTVQPATRSEFQWKGWDAQHNSTGERFVSGLDWLTGLLVAESTERIANE